MAGTSYCFELELRRQDRVAFGRFLARRRAAMRAWTALGAGTVLAVVALLWNRDLPIVAAVTCGLVGAVGGMLTAWCATALVTPRIQGRAGFDQPYRLTLGADGITAVDATTTTHRSWHAVIDVAERHRLLMLFLAPGIAVLVPRRVARDDE